MRERSLFFRCFIEIYTRVESIVSRGIGFIPKFTWVARCLWYPSFSTSVAHLCAKAQRIKHRCTNTQSSYCSRSNELTSNSFRVAGWQWHIFLAHATLSEWLSERYGDIVFATSEALLVHASSVLNCITAAVLTQGFESLNVGQPPRKSPFAIRSCRKSASSAFARGNSSALSCS